MQQDDPPSNQETHGGDKPSCLCIGGANIDIRCKFESPAQDEASNPAAICTMSGGAALNTARIVAASGIASAFAGLVGADADGQRIARDLCWAAVEPLLIKASSARTGRYVSMLQPDGVLLVAANDMRIHELWDADTTGRLKQRLASRRFDAVFLDANLPSDAIGDLVETFAGSLICASTVSVAKAPRLLPHLAGVDILFTNRAEAATLLGDRANGDNPQDLARSMSALPAGRGVISCGGAPLRYWDGAEVASLAVPWVSEIADVTGAGDALAGGTIAGLLTGAGFADALTGGINQSAAILQVEGPAPPTNRINP